VSGEETGLGKAIAAFGQRAKTKLTATVTGEPEDQLRNPIELLLADVADLCSLDSGKLAVVGETSLRDLMTRPDFAVTYNNVLVGFVELKAPGKGADPRKYKGHDKEQWDKLKALPNIIYSDGNAFSLWHTGELHGGVETLDGDIETSGNKLAAPGSLLGLFTEFFQWEPTPPRSVSELANLSAHLCRLLRDEVREQVERGDKALTQLASDWRKLLFPNANDDEFADGYAQAVTFGLLLARSRNISLDDGIDAAALKLGNVHSLIGTALRVLTDAAVSEGSLATSIRTLRRVLGVVEWTQLTNNDPNVWLYFYEGFLQEYDPALRRKTGSYYTPVPVVDAMTNMVDEALVTLFSLPSGLAAGEVTVVDPATGTGTFLLAVLRRIAQRVEADLGQGAVGPAMVEVLKRVIGFELQLGPYAVAQLRVLAELAALGAPTASSKRLRMYVTNTLGNPFIEEQELGSIYEPIAESRREANKVKASEPVFVVLGNPPYRNKARGLGGWIESGNPAASQPAPLREFMPPKAWGVGAHTKHLRDLYVYFWRWGTWKVFDDAEADTGIVCFITIAGFLDGPGFQRMREYLRQRCDHLWVIDASPEGLQPAVSTRIFQGVQQAVCIVLAARTKTADPDTPAELHYRALPTGHRDLKFAELEALNLHSGWESGATGWRDPFRPVQTAQWASYVPLDQLLWWNGSGVMPGRAWVVAPDADNLAERWRVLTGARTDAEKRELFSEHPTDRRIDTKLKDALPGFPVNKTEIEADDGAVGTPVRFQFRSFDRQWIIPDKRVINRPNPTLWELRSDEQVFMTALDRTIPRSGPAVSFSALIPDIDHYHGRAGRVFALWAAGTSVPNVAPGLLDYLGVRYGQQLAGGDVMAYVAALLAHPGYLAAVRDEFTSAGTRVPLTADPKLFQDAMGVGRRVMWLHAFGTRLADPTAGRPAGTPRLPSGQAPTVTHAIPSDPARMPNTMVYDPAAGELSIGEGRVSNVTPGMWGYEVGGVNVLQRWFSYRRQDRERPVIGERTVSRLMEVQSDRWRHEYTEELIDLLNVLGLLVELEPRQQALLDQILANELIPWDVLDTALGNSAILKRTLPTASTTTPTDDTLF
jgi:hypothetical protein